VTNDLFAALSKLEDELRFVLITSGASVVEVSEAPKGVAETELQGLWVNVAVSSAEKCSRCWHHREDVGQNAGHPELCLRCVDNVEGDGEKRSYA
ncbi:MAG: zinc finger domain-containing protein, partial [Paraglaciecola sp.]